ncbi:MAG: DUF2304 domain-containing protein [Ruminococcus sp.]|nr:DUF2304 domain-containing protein [Ruminococcus sp.]
MELQGRVALAAGILAVAAIITYLVKRQTLLLKNALPWLVMLVIVLMADACPFVTRWLESVFLLETMGAGLGFVALSALLAVTFIMEIKISKHGEREKRLIQEVAILKKMLEDLRQEDMAEHVAGEGAVAKCASKHACLARRSRE